MSSRWTDRLVRTFGGRIALWYFALFAAGAVLVLVVAGWLLQASLARRDRDAVIASLVRYTDAYVRGGVAVLERVVAADRAAAGYEPIFVRVVAGGRTRMLSMPVEWTAFDLGQLATPAIGGSTFQQIGDGEARLEVASALLPEGTLFQVGRSTTRRDAILDRYREAGLLLVGAVVLVALTGGFMLTSRALQPLHQLSATILRILQTGETSARVPTRGTSDPLDALGALVNRMLDRIDRLVRGMQSTLDNVAHDLRTPITRLRGTAEVALHSARTVDDYRDALADCVEEADRVSAILDSLMDLAEAETGTMRLRHDDIDVAGLIGEAGELYEGVADEKRVALTIAPPPEPLTIRGDRGRLLQALANVIDNAVKYTPAEGRVAVTARAVADGAEIVIADSGIGIGAEELPRIWERLYRGDRSRSERGLGIGLSLVRAIVQAHGGSVQVDSAVGRGSTFRLHLPHGPAAAGARAART